MKSREEMIAKATELKGTHDAVELETRGILLDLAGTSEDDMFSESGAYDLLFNLADDSDHVVQAAAEAVREFLS